MQESRAYEMSEKGATRKGENATARSLARYNICLDLPPLDHLIVLVFFSWFVHSLNV